MRNFKLLTSVAAAALLTGMTAASADPVNVGDVDQFVGNYGGILNLGFMDVGSLGGLGSSASIGATGSAAAISLSEIGSNGTPLNLTVGGVEQDARTGAWGHADGIYIVNFGDLDQSGNIDGDGASLSISATGAVTATSASFIQSPAFDQISIATGRGETVDQESRNRASVTNINSRFSDIDAGNIGGDGASIGVSATGSVAAVSLTSIQNFNLGNVPDVDIGNIYQTSVNIGTIDNFGGRVETKDITGEGASVSIGATGAVAAVSATSINDAVSIHSIDIGNVEQNVYNSGDVTNSGRISSRNITTSGLGASASIASTGSVAAASITDIGSVGSIGQIDVGAVNQNSTNTGAVTNLGSLSVGNLSGNGSSASISATGAAAAVSVSTIH